MLKSEQIPMEVQDALNKAHGFIISPQALATAINAWPGAFHNGHWLLFPHTKLLLPMEKSND